MLAASGQHILKHLKEKKITRHITDPYPVRVCTLRHKLKKNELRISWTTAVVSFHDKDSKTAQSSCCCRPDSQGGQGLQQNPCDKSPLWEFAFSTCEWIMEQLQIEYHKVLCKCKSNSLVRRNGVKVRAVNRQVATGSAAVLTPWLSGCFLHLR